MSLPFQSTKGFKGFSELTNGLKKEDGKIQLNYNSNHFESDSNGQLQSRLDYIIGDGLTYNSGTDKIETVGETSVEDYNTVGDGITNDGQAFQNAIDAVSGGDVQKTLKLSSGKTYSIGQKLVINKSNVRIEGNGAKLINDGSIESMFEIQGELENLSFENFTIEATDIGGTSLQQGVIANFDNHPLTNIYFDRVNVHTNQGSGITFESDDGQNETGTITNFSFTNCTVESDDSSQYGLSLRKHANQVFINNNRFIMNHSSSYNNLALYAGAENFEVSNNYFFGGGHSPLACSPARYGSITGNILEYGSGSQASDEGGIEIEWKNSHRSLETSHDITCTGNVVRGYHWGIFVVRRDTDDIRPYNITITGNVVEDASNRGILIDALRDVSVTNNIVYNAGFKNIDVWSCENITITGNICKNSSNPDSSIIDITQTSAGTADPLTDKANVSNNTIQGWRGDRRAIRINSSDGNTVANAIITGNIMDDDGSGGDFIVIDGDDSGVQIIQANNMEIVRD